MLNNKLLRQEAVVAFLRQFSIILEEKTTNVYSNRALPKRMQSCSICAFSFPPSLGVTPSFQLQFSISSGIVNCVDF
jgi:hypothetical protein